MQTQWTKVPVFIQDDFMTVFKLKIVLAAICTIDLNGSWSITMELHYGIVPLNDPQCLDHYMEEKLSGRVPSL